MGSKTIYLAGGALLILAFLLTLASDASLKIQRYKITTNKVDSNVRMAFVTDLHGCRYGEGQKELLDALKKEEPQLVLLGGDIVDDVYPEEGAKEFLKEIGKLYPCYYVSGNHECRSDNFQGIKAYMKDYGIEVLEGEIQAADVNGQKISIFGVDDPRIGEAVFREQLSNYPKVATKEMYSVLLTHRPERIKEYLKYDFDLILAGHAHGGQWRIPGLINGIFAPNQGLFPKYAGGLYKFGPVNFIVSRGLARETTRLPRLFNHPEFVVIEIAPGK